MDFQFFDTCISFQVISDFTNGKGKKIGLLPGAKPILVAIKVSFSNQGEGKALCDRMASGTLSIDGELS